MPASRNYRKCKVVVFSYKWCSTKSLKNITLGIAEVCPVALTVFTVQRWLCNAARDVIGDAGRDFLGVTEGKHSRVTTLAWVGIVPSYAEYNWSSCGWPVYTMMIKLLGCTDVLVEFVWWYDINSLSAGEYDSIFKSVIFKLIWWVNISSSSCVIAPRKMPYNLINDHWSKY